jgi:hypothetical protein
VAEQHDSKVWPSGTGGFALKLKFSNELPLIAQAPHMLLYALPVLYCFFGQINRSFDHSQSQKTKAPVTGLLCW